MRACIIGAGVIGCAVALELRRRGFDVTVIEKNGDAGHGSTAASCGIVRRFYSQPGMIALAHEGAQIWAAHPLQLALPRIGVTVDSSFLSRQRGQIQTSSTVIG